ncbi:hypothetical protein EDD17DRAFT_1901076 [Pisolithus thermaeus]|nr:hypothetical protein EDD17DRAFT_1901076 [Pisolithus thermaeus]
MFYYPDGMHIFHVQNMLFKVHKSILLDKSLTFKTMFDASDHTGIPLVNGFTDNKVILIPKQVMDTTFKLFLSVCYNKWCLDAWQAPESTIVKLLKLSQMYELQDVCTYATKQLSSCCYMIKAINLASISLKYQIKETFCCAFCQQIFMRVNDLKNSEFESLSFPVTFGTVPSVVESLLRYTFGTTPSVVESLLRLPTAIFYSYWIIRRMDYLPELTHNGHNWTTYASSVLCAISDEGLMGFLVGSERRPTHPAELMGHEAAAWRAADQSWTQRNAMVNYTIVIGIPDTIFSHMLHLKSPLEKWSYLEDHFGRIPRPEIWLVAEEAEQQSNSNMATGAGQEAHDSNNELQNSPSSHEDPVDSPSDCAETEAGRVKPEPKVVDAQHLKPYLRGVEVEAIDSKQPAEGMDALEAPDSSSQCAGDKVKEEDLPTTSSKALKTQQDLPDAMSECAETQTGHTKPKDEVVDTRHVVDVLPMFEVGSTGQAWYSKHVKDLQASDEGGWHASDEVEESRDLPKSSSEVLKPMSIKDSQRTWMNSKTIANIPDPPSTPMKHPTPHVEHPRLRKWPSAQACSATTTEFDLLHTRRSSKRREMQCLKLDCKQAPGRPK